MNCPVKWRLALMAVIATVIVFAAGAGWAGQEATRSEGQADITAVPHCPICGMDRAKFAHSRMFVTCADGTVLSTCSLHCAAVDLATRLGSAPASIQVGDYTGRPIDAREAYLVLGSDVFGPMGKELIPFDSQAAAREFNRDHHGTRVVRWAEIRPTLLERLR